MFLVDGIKRLSEDWFGGSDCYRFCYTVYVAGGVVMLRRKHIDRNKYVFAFIRCLQTVLLTVYLVCSVSFIYDAYLLRKDINKLPYTLSVTIFFINWASRTWILTARKDEVEDVFEEITAHFHQEGIGTSRRDVAIFERGKRHFKVFAAVFSFLSFVGLIMKMLYHLVTEPSLLVPFPFADGLGSPGFEITFTLETIGLMLFVTNVIAHVLVIYSIFIRVLEHFIILSKNIKDMEKVLCRREKPDEILVIGKMEFNQMWMELEWKWKQKTVSELLKKNISHHQEIVKIMRRTNNLLQECFFIEIFGGGLLLVDVFFHVTLLRKGDSVFVFICQFIFFLESLLDITIICYYGSEIEAKSHAAARSLSSIDWLDMDLGNRQTLRLFQQGLWRHPVVKAANVFSINLKMYLKLLNSTYSYLAFIQKTLKRND